MIFNFYFSVFLVFFIFSAFTRLRISLRKSFMRQFISPFFFTIILLVIVLYYGKFLPKPFTFGYAQFKSTDVFFSRFITISMLGFAITFYNQISHLKKYILVCILACLFSVTLSSFLVIYLAKLFHLDRYIVASLVARNISTVFGMEVAKSLAGNVSLVVIAITITGTIGNIVVGPLHKKFGKDKIALGVAIGSTTHIIGSSKALEYDELTGSISGFSLVVSGLYYVLILSHILRFFL